MDFARKVIIVFLIIFNFRIPGFYNSTVLCIVLCLGYYAFFRKSLPFRFFFYRYVVVALGGLLAITVLSYCIVQFYGTYDYSLIKIFFLQILMMVALVFAFPLLLSEEEGSQSFEEVGSILCHTFFLQGLIQITGFTVPAVGDFLISIRSEASQQQLMNDVYNTYFRGYCLCGQPFFELPAGYGLVFITFFKLLSLRGRRWISTQKAVMMFPVFLAGSIMSGRTAFVGLGMGVILCFFLFPDWIKLIGVALKYALVYTLLGGVIYVFMLSPTQKNKLLNDVFPFAFEAFYNFRDTGKFSTTSSDVMIEKHYFPLSYETLVHGDGRYDNPDGTYYRGTDAGYMRYVLFGGVPFQLCMVVYVLLFFSWPLRLSFYGGSREDRADFLYFLTLLLHLFVINYKGTAMGSMNNMQVLLLLLGMGYMMRYYYYHSPDSGLHRVRASRQLT